MYGSAEVGSKISEAEVEEGGKAEHASKVAAESRGSGKPG